jgi:hypothetical protein
MALLSSTPIEQDGRTYDKLAVTMVVNPTFEENYIKTSMVFTLIPYCIDEDGSVHSLQEYKKIVISSDLLQSIESDLILGQAMSSILVSLQTFITDKGL